MNEPLMHATIALAARCAENDSSLTLEEACVIAQDLADTHGLDGHDRNVLLGAAESFASPPQEVLEDPLYEPALGGQVDTSEWTPSSLPFQRSVAKSLKPAVTLVSPHDTQHEAVPQAKSELQGRLKLMMIPVASPVALPPTAPAVQSSPRATILRSSARIASVRRRARAHPNAFALGGIIVSSAAAAIAIVLATASPQEHTDTTVVRPAAAAASGFASSSVVINDQEAAPTDLALSAEPEAPVEPAPSGSGAATRRASVYGSPRPPTDALPIPRDTSGSNQPDIQAMAIVIEAKYQQKDYPGVLRACRLLRGLDLDLVADNCFYAACRQNSVDDAKRWLNVGKEANRRPRVANCKRLSNLGMSTYALDCARNPLDCHTLNRGH